MNETKHTLNYEYHSRRVVVIAEDEEGFTALKRWFVRNLEPKMWRWDFIAKWYMILSPKTKEGIYIITALKQDFVLKRGIK